MIDQLKDPANQFYLVAPDLQGKALIHNLILNTIRPGGFNCLVLFDNQTQNSPEHDTYIVGLVKQLFPDADAFSSAGEALNAFNAFCAQEDFSASYRVVRYATGFIFTNDTTKALVYLLMVFDRQLQPGVCFPYREFLKIPQDALLKTIARNAPLARPVAESLVQDISLSWEEMITRFPDGYGGYDWAAYQQWVIAQMDEGAFYYAREKHNFFPWQAYSTCALSGRTKLIMDNLS